MNVKLTIGYNHFIMNIADASKVMEALMKAIVVESYYINENNHGYYEVQNLNVSIEPDNTKYPILSYEGYKEELKRVEEKEIGMKILDPI